MRMIIYIFWELYIIFQNLIIYINRIEPEMDTNEVLIKIINEYDRITCSVCQKWAEPRRYHNHFAILMFMCRGDMRVLGFWRLRRRLYRRDMHVSRRGYMSPGVLALCFFFINYSGYFGGPGILVFRKF